uniref:SH2 domain containing 4A n=1 Tax=Mustela putorius furo TaxID=9669 RepID=M3YN58_MUSPF
MLFQDSHQASFPLQFFYTSDFNNGNSKGIPIFTLSVSTTFLNSSAERSSENGKSVHWKLGADKEVWVWVMGEHHLDKPYDVLCNEIIAERAQLKAEREAEDLRKTQSKEFANNLKMKSQYYDLQAPDTQETQNICKKAATEAEKLGKGSRPAPLLEEEKIASLSSSSRNIQQMLADSINRMKAYGFHQKKEPEKKTQDEELKQIDEEKAKQIYKSWKEDSEWQASLSSARDKPSQEEKGRNSAGSAGQDSQELREGVHRVQCLPAPLVHPPPTPPRGVNDLGNDFFSYGQKPKKNLRNQGVRRTASNSAQEDIIRWFKEEQLPLRAGYQTTSDTIAPWFHGILTLKRANELLSTCEPGSFLVRVSERIKGYALSYLSEDGCKHFLIDASTDSYSFLGVDRLQHATLAALVDYHKVEPITSLGKELLLYPCGQQGEPPDYLELFE